MSVRASQVVTHQFGIYDRNGAGCAFDASPVPAAVLLRDGVETLVSVSIDTEGDFDAAAGQHSVSFTVPDDVVQGERLQVRFVCAADSVEAPGYVWEDMVDNLIPDVGDIAAGLEGATINILGSVYPSGEIRLVKGDDYTAGFAVSITLPATAPDLTGADLAYILESGVAISVSASCSNPGTSAQLVPLAPTKTQTEQLSPNSRGLYQLQATYPSQKPRTIAGGVLVVDRKLVASS